MFHQISFNQALSKHLLAIDSSWGARIRNQMTQYTACHTRLDIQLDFSLIWFILVLKLRFFNLFSSYTLRVKRML